jgi:hypothetical protein
LYANFWRAGCFGVRIGFGGRGGGAAAAECDGAAGIGRPDSSASDRADREYRRLDPSRDGDLTCYTIDSYLVKRQSADSDVVEPSGHSSCQRASKYGVKAAVGAGKAASH